MNWGLHLVDVSNNEHRLLLKRSAHGDGEATPCPDSGCPCLRSRLWCRSDRWTLKTRGCYDRSIKAARSVRGFLNPARACGRNWVGLGNSSTTTITLGTAQSEMQVTLAC